MYIQNELRLISERLHREKICFQALDERSLSLIHHYMGLSETGSDLIRRLSDIEINFELITEEAEEAIANIKDTVIGAERLLKDLIDTWKANGLIDDFSFTCNKADAEAMYCVFSNTAENLRPLLDQLALALETLEETAAQTKGCSASFLEIYNETKLAFYAAALNKDSDNILSCKAISLQAHGSFTESQQLASRYLNELIRGNNAVTVLNFVLSEATSDFSNLIVNKSYNKTKVVNNIIKAIDSLKNILSR